MLAAAASAASARMSTMQTFMPSSQAAWRATPSPMPDADPVITATPPASWARSKGSRSGEGG
jgi:hypothetical protein